MLGNDNIERINLLALSLYIVQTETDSESWPNKIRHSFLSILFLGAENFSTTNRKTTEKFKTNKLLGLSPIRFNVQR